MENMLKPNDGKELIMEVEGMEFARFPIKTHLITKDDDIVEVACQYARPVLTEPGDLLIIAGRSVSCAQGRAIPLSEIHPKRLAINLSSHVTMTPYGIGLAMPETMQMAMQEAGTLRVLFAAAASVIGKKIFKKKGWFYKIIGPQASMVDGPHWDTIPPYGHYVTLAPLNPDAVCRQIKERLGHEVCIIDANEFRVNVLGVSTDKIDPQMIARILKDNPLGQTSEQTPMGIIRRIK